MAALFCSAVPAQVPREINYQGYLTTPNGTPVTATLPIVFRLYAADSGGMALWPRIGPRLGFVSDQLPPPRKRNRSYISDLYLRIVVMQVTIIAGAWIAQEVAPGAAWPLILLILLKTAVGAGSSLVSRYFRVEAGGNKP